MSDIQVTDADRAAARTLLASLIAGGNIYSNSEGIDGDICTDSGAEEKMAQAIASARREGPKSDLQTVVDTLGKLEINHVFFLPDEAGRVRVFLNMNDVFAWACADCEVVETADDAAQLEKAHADIIAAGDRFVLEAEILYAVRRRGICPQDLTMKRIEKRSPITHKLIREAAESARGKGGE